MSQIQIMGSGMNGCRKMNRFGFVIIIHLPLNLQSHVAAYLFVDQLYRDEPWLEGICCVLRRDTSLSQYLSLPRCINGYHPANLMLVGNPVKD